jgi:hypothetical protein
MKAGTWVKETPEQYAARKAKAAAKAEQRI